MKTTKAVNKSGKSLRADREERSFRVSTSVCPSRKAGPEPGPQNPESVVEILIEGQECPFCHFARLKRDADEIVCPLCGYGRKPCT